MASFTLCSPRRVLVVVGILLLITVLRVFLSKLSQRRETFLKRNRNEISLLTYNIWRKSTKLRERMVALGKIVEQLRPDIISFQEATEENLLILKRQSWFSRYNMVPQDNSRESGKHFVIILSVFPVDNWWEHIYTSGSEDTTSHRKMLVADVLSEVVPTLEDYDFTIVGTHLAYGLKGTKTREKQLKEALYKLSDHENVCIMGDLNIEDKVDGQVSLPSPWFDAWLSVPGNTDENGLTFDKSKSPFNPVSKNPHQARLDRMLCKLRDLKVKEMKVVGDKVTRSGVWPSDHFGLFTVLELLMESRIQDTSKNKEELYFKRPAGWKKLIRGGR